MTTRGNENTRSEALHGIQKLSKSRFQHIKSYQSFTVFYTNAEIKKRNELDHSITLVEPESICIPEILPKNASLPADNTELQIQGFTSSNKSLCHRGVLIHTNKCLKTVAVSFSEVGYREYVYCKLASKNIGLLHILYICRSHLFQSFQN